MLEFSIATPWDEAFLAELQSLNQDLTRSQFTEVFGSHRISITGGGRPAFRLPDVSDERFEQHVRVANEQGLLFNYVITHLPFRIAKQILSGTAGWWRFLEYLADCGVNKLTIANMSLLKLVKQRFPRFLLTVSLIAGTDTVEQAREYEALGVNVINLNPFTINRDFTTLAEIRQAVQCKLEVYANIACLDHCPKRDAHYMHSGTSSRDGGRTDVAEDVFLPFCSGKFLAEPVELLRSPFIRPEDLYVYDDLGMDIVKLADRTESAEVLMHTARVYAAERYEGNLFELIFRKGKKFRAGIASSLPQYQDMAVPVVIDNQGLNRIEFIEHIRTLSGDELEDFYHWAVEQAVSFPDPEVINIWKQLLNSA